MDFGDSAKRKLWLLAAVLVPAILLGAVKFCFTQKGHESAEDAFWHVAAARRSLGEMTAKRFPLTLSVWRDHFADKELGFHLLQKLCIQAEKLAGIPLEPPFTGILFFFLLLIFAAFAFAGTAMGISPPRIFYAAMLCAVFLPNFTYRILMLRPHIFSIALMLTAFAILSRGPHLKKICLAVFAFSFLYAWSYSTPHVICVTVFLFGLAWFPKEGWKAFAALPCSIAGIFCGLLIHPQSPNTLLIWKLQALDALLAPISGSAAVRLPFATELEVPKFAWILLALPALLAVYFLLMTYVRAIEKEGLKQIPPNLSALVFSALFWTLAMCTISIRPVEYAIPSLCLAGAAVLPYAKEHRLFSVLENEKGVWIFLIAVLTVCGTFTVNNVCQNLRKWSNPAPMEMAEFLRKTLPPGTRIANPVWSDFPYLFYAAPEYEYTWALDPMFGYAYAPDRISVIAKLTLNRIRREPSTVLSKAADAEYAVVLFRDRNHLGNYFERTCGWKVLYLGPDGWVFKLKQ